MDRRILGKRYEIIELVGGGGMALVYRARDNFLNRIVAVKILREQFTGDEEFVARFRREAQAVASLSHGNIVSIYDVGQEDNVYYLVMEMVEGRNLKEIIKERGALPGEEAFEITRQICDALEHAHEHKIIHRDIKPHNIIITKNGKVKVTDFGIARAVSTATVTHTGSIVGSVHYFSPEQAKGEIAGEKSDLYSLGVVLYEMLTGQLPFEGESPIGVAVKKLHDDPPSPRAINANISEAVDKVILRAMARDPADRYDSAAQLKKDFSDAFLYNRLNYQPQEHRVTGEDTVPLPKIERKRVQKSKPELSKRRWTIIIAGVVIAGFILGMFLSSQVLSRGDVTVPNVVNKPLGEAEAALRQASLTMEIIRRDNHPEVLAGYIILQEPKGDEIVKKNGSVQVVVSEGPKMVIVPDVLKSSLIAAEVALANEGLKVGEISRAYHSQIISGQVIHQDPAANQEVIQGTGVNLIVSKGPEPVWVEVPDLTGYSLSQAKTVVLNSGLLLGVVQPEISYKYEQDRVIRQDPGPNTEIIQGTPVNLVVSSGPGPLVKQD